MSNSPHVTDAELSVLEFLWNAGPSTVRSIADRLYPGGGNSEHATVQKLCERLLAKGCVVSDRSVRPRTFAASVDREVLIRGQLNSVAERFCRGSLAPLLSHLVEGGELSRDEIDSLRDQIDQLDGEAKSARKPKRRGSGKPRGGGAKR